MSIHSLLLIADNVWRVRRDRPDASGTPKTNNLNPESERFRQREPRDWTADTLVSYI